MSASIVFRRQEDIALVDMVAEHSVLQYSISYLPYLELDTQVVSSPASIGCTVISGHSYVRNRSRQSIMSTSIVFRRQEDIALVDIVAEHSVL